MAWWISGEGDPAAREAARPGGTYTRANFQALVMGKSEAEVVQAVGNPDTTAADGQVKTWQFLRRTLHPVSGRTDTAATVHFTDGVVDRVTFN
jgi:hypothetical protein